MFSVLLFMMYFERDFTMSNVNLKLLFRMQDFQLYRCKPFPNGDFLISRFQDAVKMELIDL